MTSEEVDALIEQLLAIDEESLNIAPWTAEQLCKKAAGLIAAYRDALGEIADGMPSHRATRRFNAARAVARRALGWGEG
jgi:hypothetical protein